MQEEKMVTIELSGILGKTFGKTHQRIITTTSEAIRALCCTLNGFEQYLNTSKSRGLTYAVFKGKKNIGVDDLNFPISEEIIRIVPIVVGSKRGGVFQTIFGAILVAAAIWLPWGSALWASNLLFAVGASVAIGGVIQMLSPQPKGLAMQDQSENKPSYAFGSPTNTISQGYPVPVLYGERTIGGAIISAGIYVEDQQ